MNAQQCSATHPIIAQYPQPHVCVCVFAWHSLQCLSAYWALSAQTAGAHSVYTDTHKMCARRHVVNMYPRHHRGTHTHTEMIKHVKTHRYENELSDILTLMIYREIHSLIQNKHTHTHTGNIPCKWLLMTDNATEVIPSQNLHHCELRRNTK